MAAEPVAGLRYASTLYATTSFSIDVKMYDTAVHQISLYALDWDQSGRSERIDVLDAATGKTLDSRTISSFQNGVYLSWAVRGHVHVVVTALTGNAVVSGLFFDPAPRPRPRPCRRAPGTAVAFAGTDASTQGNWKGTAGGVFGGAIDNAGTATLLDVTVAGNQVGYGQGPPRASTTDGSGIENEAGAVLARRTPSWRAAPAATTSRTSASSAATTSWRPPARACRPG